MLAGSESKSTSQETEIFFDIVCEKVAAGDDLEFFLANAEKITSLIGKITKKEATILFGKIRSPELLGLFVDDPKQKQAIAKILADSIRIFSMDLIGILATYLDVPAIMGNLLTLVEKSFVFVTLSNLQPIASINLQHFEFFKNLDGGNFKDYLRFYWKNVRLAEEVHILVAIGASLNPSLEGTNDHSALIDLMKFYPYEQVPFAIEIVDAMLAHGLNLNHHSDCCGTVLRQAQLNVRIATEKGWEELKNAWEKFCLQLRERGAKTSEEVLQEYGVTWGEVKAFSKRKQVLQQSSQSSSTDPQGKTVVSVMAPSSASPAALVGRSISAKLASQLVASLSTPEVEHQNVASPDQASLAPMSVSGSSSMAKLVSESLSPALNGSRSLPVVPGKAAHSSDLHRIEPGCRWVFCCVM